MATTNLLPGRSGVLIPKGFTHAALGELLTLTSAPPPQTGEAAYLTYTLGGPDPGALPRTVLKQFPR